MLHQFPPLARCECSKQPKLTSYLFPIYLIKQGNICRYQTHINGIGSHVSVISKIISGITMANTSSPTFQNMNTLVTYGTIPILVSQNVLCHDTLALYTMNNQNTSTPVYGVQSITSQPMVKHQVNIQSLEQKLDWLGKNHRHSPPSSPQP